MNPTSPFDLQSRDNSKRRGRSLIALETHFIISLFGRQYESK